MNNRKKQNISIQRKQKIVKKFLLLPIKVKRKSEILIDDIAIFTGQKYYSGKDPDMSNIAVEFYEIMYDKEILKEKKLVDKNFAGDTMSSFETVANDVAKNIPGMGKTKKQRKGQSHEIWPEYLQKYYEQYHCLANFWILPMKEGRMLSGKYKKGTIDDYMDKYLESLANIYNNNFKNKYSTYVNEYNTFKDFCKKHSLDGSYIKNNEIVSFSNIDNLTDRIKIMKKLIEERADCISKSKYCDQLFELYNRYRKKP